MLKRANDVRAAVLKRGVHMGRKPKLTELPRQKESRQRYDYDKLLSTVPGDKAYLYVRQRRVLRRPRVEFAARLSAMYALSRTCILNLLWSCTEYDDDCGSFVFYSRVNMRLIAHRGWAAGGGENSLAAFARAARDDVVSGVEFDVCRAANSHTIVVSHDPPLDAQGVLTLDAALSFLSSTNLELFVEIKEERIVLAVIEKLISNKLADRSVVFAFAPIARSFPWEAARQVRQGVIVMCPWNVDRIVRQYAPDVVLLGWDERDWTRFAFRTWWSLFSLERVARRHQVPLVVGIAQRMGDLQWLSRQHLYGAVADVPLIRGLTQD